VSLRIRYSLSYGEGWREEARLFVSEPISDALTLDYSPGFPARLLRIDNALTAQVEPWINEVLVFGRPISGKEFALELNNEICH